MNIRTVRAVSFSPTGNTARITNYIAGQLAKRLGAELRTESYTLPAERTSSFSFAADEMVIWGTPTYAGRIPNKTLDYVSTAIHGENTPAVPIAVYGNRSFDNALAELTGILENSGCVPIAGAGLVSRHTFSKTLAAGRPNDADIAEMDVFCDRIAKLLRSRTDLSGARLTVAGEKNPPKYYTPKKTDGTPAKFLKAKPQLLADRCSGCGTCTGVCPMGSVRMEGKAPAFPGICIKCQACIRRCPEQALYFDDPDFLSHVEMLETNFTAPNTNAFFLAEFG